MVTVLQWQLTLVWLSSKLLLLLQNHFLPCIIVEYNVVVSQPVISPAITLRTNNCRVEGKQTIYLLMHSQERGSGRPPVCPHGPSSQLAPVKPSLTGVVNVCPPAAHVGHQLLCKYNGVELNEFTLDTINLFPANGREDSETFGVNNCFP